MTLMLPRAPRRGIAGVVVALLVSLLAVIDAGPLASPARAADPTDPVFQSVSGGTRINVAGTVYSELTGASSLRVTRPGRSASNKIADVNVLDGLITAEAVSTRQRTTRSLTGATSIISEAKITGVGLLGGAITVDAIDTQATATLNGNEVKRTGRTKLVNLYVQDNDLPIAVPKNTAVTIPGIAKVVLNEVKGQVGGDALIKSVATGIKITLLNDYGQLGKGATIEITPAKAQILLPVPIDGDPLFGAAYSTRTRIQVGETLKLNAGPTSAMIMPAGGTNGLELETATARLNLPGLAKARVLSGTAQGVVTPAESDGEMIGRVADVDLLGGLISVDAVVGKARLNKQDGSPPSVEAVSRLVGLTINGETYPIQAEPNTVVEIPGLVKVIINEQIRQTFPFNGIAVRALHVIALPGAPDDLVGLDMELGVAAIWVNN